MSPPTRPSNADSIKASEAFFRYVGGKNYFQAAHLIIRSPDFKKREKPMALPLSQLIGYSVELYLKSFLLACGMTSCEIRAYSHRLRDLHSEAVNRGLQIDGLDQTVDLISGGHEDFSFRYMEQDSTFNMLNWPATMKVLNALDNFVDEKVGASAAYGLKPGRTEGES